MSRRPIGVILGYAGLLMVLALGCQNKSVASGNYVPILLLAFGLMLLADGLCLVAYQRGGLAQLAALVIAAPSFFIVVDCVYRLAAWILR
jgi:hypothetical protein